MAETNHLFSKSHLDWDGGGLIGTSGPFFKFCSCKTADVQRFRPRDAAPDIHKREHTRKNALPLG